MKFSLMIGTMMLGLGQAQAADLKVVTDIAPVGSLVSYLSDGQITVLVKPGQSPHDISLRPSQARALREADVVVWMGEGLSPSLEASLEQLAGKAAVVELLALNDMDYLPRREDPVFAVDPEDGHEDAHGHDHGHGDDVDPHAWLDPSIAAQWLDPIAAALTVADPENAELYQAKAVTGSAALAQLGQEVLASLTDQHDTGFFVSHDAFQYFERAFDIEVLGAVTASDGSQASVARMGALQKSAKEGNATCLLTDSTVSGASMKKTADALGLQVRSLDILFPSETDTDMKDVYVEILSGIANGIGQCGGA